jgi:hypothetical protein
MRIAFWASAALVVLLSATVSEARGSVHLISGGTLCYSASQGKTKLDIRTMDGKRYVLRVERDATVSPGISPSQLTVLGEIKDTAIIFIDTYPSKHGGMSYCQAGEERFLRIVSIAQKPAVETYRIKLASCLENIELSSPGIDWHPESSKLDIHWLQGPEKNQKPAELTLQIGTNGRLE